MASVDSGGGGSEKGKPKKMNLRVDFTPMVDMNMLLITFFMFCTTLSKPQVMDIAMPTNDPKTDDDSKNKVKESKTITLLLGENNKVYYYAGMLTDESYNDYTTLKETDFSPEGLRGILLKRNAQAVTDMRELKLQKAEKGNRMSEEDFRKKSNEIKGHEDAQVVVIKPTDAATYKNLVDALDEMQICSIGKYAIVEMSVGDKFLVENLKTEGEFGRQNLAPKKK